MDADMKNSFDAAIIGGGIGGACAAIRLAKSGARVLVLEAGKFPRHKVCGEFLSPESKKVFAHLGVLESIQNAGATEISTSRIVARGGQTLEIALPRAALSLSRFRLDEILIRAAQDAGASLFSQTRVRHVQENKDDFTIATSHGEFSARAVLNAAGRNAAFLSRQAGSTPGTGDGLKFIGLKTHFRGADFPLGLVELHAWRGGYCGVSQIENGLTNVCLLARYDSLAGRAPQEFWKWLLQHLPELRARLENAQMQMPWLATGNISFGASTPGVGGVLHCGDAVGFIHPLVGNGMAMAARGGELAAAILSSQLRGEISQNAAREIYEKSWRREFQSRLKWAGIFQKLLIDSQLLASALNGLSLFPRLGERAVRLTRGQL
jgi:flavin-dependent dehydrogenase